MIDPHEIKKQTDQLEDKLNGMTNSAEANSFPILKKIPVQLARSIDGDTSDFLLNGETIRVRYLLIDTPETVQPGVSVQPFGKEASDRTKGLLENASVIEIMFDRGDQKEKTIDRKPRTLVYVFVDGKLVQDILVREGLARIAYVSESNTTYLEQLTASENIARSQGVGIWSLKGYVTERGFN
ncbi:thermonuclease family protein [Enterococcus rivorum]